MKKIGNMALFALVLSSCGGSDGTSVLSYDYQGTVSGLNCFSGTPESTSISYSIRLDDFSPGSGVTLVDQAGTTWTGSLTSLSSFKVTNSMPGADPRTSIVVSDFNSEGAHVASTTMCVSFRCCTTLTGDVRS